MKSPRALFALGVAGLFGFVPGSWSVNPDLPDGPTRFEWDDPVDGLGSDAGASGGIGDGNEGRGPGLDPGSVPLDFRHSPTAPADLSEAAGRLSIRFRARSGRVESAHLVADGDSIPMHRQLDLGEESRWRASVEAGVASYEIVVETPDSVAVFGPWSVPAERFAAVDWVSGSVGYQIFPERFWNGDPSNDSLALSTDEYVFLGEGVSGTPPELAASWDAPVGNSHCCHQYFGGDLQGILDRLPDLEARGVDVLYLNPIFASGSAHGYDTSDYLRVAESFGDSIVLRSLLGAAHARGMRVIWDFVPNHVGIGHGAFRDAVERGETSPYWDWFDFRVPGGQVQAGNGDHYSGWWGFGSLPELETEVAAVRDHLLEVATTWTEFGFDGIRVDVPGDIDNRSGFFPEWRAAVKAVRPDVYLVGEIWEQDESWLQGDEFDALMNYALGQGGVLPFARGEMPGPTAARRMAEQYALYPEASAAMAFNLITSHDTDRLATMLGGGDLGGSASAEVRARHRLAVAVLYALPGMPMTFQGDECGFLGRSEGDHTARYPIQWEACDAELVSYYARLGALRQASTAVTSPVFRTVDGSGRLLAFLRGEPGEDEVLAVFNNRGSAESMTLPTGRWVDLDDGSTASGSVTVDGYGWRWLERR